MRVIPACTRVAGDPSDHNVFEIADLAKRGTILFFAVTVVTYIVIVGILPQHVMDWPLTLFLALWWWALLRHWAFLRGWVLFLRNFATTFLLSTMEHSKKYTYWPTYRLQYRPIFPLQGRRIANIKTTTNGIIIVLVTEVRIDIASDKYSGVVTHAIGFFVFLGNEHQSSYG